MQLAQDISLRIYVKKRRRSCHFAYMDGWSVRSNAESGEGYSDISIEIRPKGIGIVIELKYAEDGAFDGACRETLRQIRDRKYEDDSQIWDRLLQEAVQGCARVVRDRGITAV